MATSSTSKTRKIPAEYTPISMWGYFGYQILFSIPLIGWIIVIVFAITAPNQNLKNFACSQFCLLIIALVATVIFAATGLLATMIESLSQA